MTHTVDKGKLAQRGGDRNGLFLDLGFSTPFWVVSLARKEPGERDLAEKGLGFEIEGKVGSSGHFLDPHAARHLHPSPAFDEKNLLAGGIVTDNHRGMEGSPVIWP